jgi:SAM-dependent methyltransferase
VGEWRSRRAIEGEAMTERTEFFDTIYGNFSDPALHAIRKETFGQDIGQNSWLTVDEYDRFTHWLDLDPKKHVLEVASGSGGPALYLARQAGCRVTGIDENESGVATATRAAKSLGLEDRARFVVGDATAPLEFEDRTFDGLLCIDSMNHFPDRLAVLREWRRVLKAGGRAVFTDPVVITGPLTNEDLALRSSIGLFLFVPPGITEKMIEEAGLRLDHKEDVSDNAAQVADRWRRARERHRDDVLKIEGEERFASFQRFFGAVHRLTSERRLSRIAYFTERV